MTSPIRAAFSWYVGDDVSKLEGSIERAAAWWLWVWVAIVRARLFAALI